MRPLPLLTIMVICMLIHFSCDKEESLQANQTQQNATIVIDPNNPDYHHGEIPEATVDLVPHRKKLSKRSHTASSLEPSELVVSTQAGIPFSEEKTATLGLPSVGDVMFHFDLSGSMGGEIANVKINSQNIFNAINDEIDDLVVGVSSGIESFTLNQDLTSDATTFDNAVDGLILGNGFAEDYGEHFSELASQPSWRTNAAQFVIAFLDEDPQGYDVLIEDGLETLQSAGMTLVVIHSGPDGFYTPWESLAAMGKLNLFRINQDGSIPGGVDIATFVTEAIESSFCDVELVELKAVDPSYQSWIMNVNPPQYSEVNVCPAAELNFEITFKVPNCTSPGDYELEVGLFGDDIKYASQTVKVTVEPFAVALDIHPGSCPNPLNTRSGGFTPVAILGSDQLDVRDIDIDQISLNGVAPSSYSYEDVGTPQMPLLNKPTDPYACNTAGADGFEDLTLKFRTQDLVAALGNPQPGEVYILELDAVLDNGMCIDGEDVIKIAN